MREGCRLCGDAAGDGRCFVKAMGVEFCACRPCWEQVVLAPARVLRSLLPDALRGPGVSADEVMAKLSKEAG